MGDGGIASSPGAGKTSRHRLNLGGDRQANAALHPIVRYGAREAFQPLRSHAGHPHITT